MTTKEAAERYLQEHMAEYNGRPAVVFNPHGRPLEELPVIYGFNNGGSPDWLRAVAIAEDGEVLAQHVCSNEGYMLADLGIIVGGNSHKHETCYKPHYPDGYRMMFVERERSHQGFEAALEKNRLIALDEMMRESHDSAARRA